MKPNSSNSLESSISSGVSTAEFENKLSLQGVENAYAPRDSRSQEADARERKETYVAMMQEGEKKTTLKANDFEKIGPKAAEFLKQNGISEISITPGKNGAPDKIEATLDKPLSIDQDPAVDGCRKLKVDKHFSAEVSKKPDGTIVFDNIEGLKAETKVLYSWKDASVTHIELRKNEKGETEITSTGELGAFSRTRTRVKPAEIMEKAGTLFERLEKLKDQNSTKDKMGYLQFSNVFVA
ncbi:MAG: hypothetical protein JST89_17245 [Cyanobacteria bacterium SZAS-4]|nr:hypothetical protein [Cyanobacteria bacterium SZAS-4]